MSTEAIEADFRYFNKRGQLVWFVRGLVPKSVPFPPTIESILPHLKAANDGELPDRPPEGEAFYMIIFHQDGWCVLARMEDIEKAEEKIKKAEVTE